MGGEGGKKSTMEQEEGREMRIPGQGLGPRFCQSRSCKVQPGEAAASEGTSPTCTGPGLLHWPLPQQRSWGEGTEEAGGRKKCMKESRIFPDGC